MGVWFWSLRGWDLLAISISILSGILVGIGSMVVWVGKLLTKGAEHDQKTCECWDCKNRRARAYARRAAGTREGRRPPVSQAGEGRSDGDVFPAMGRWGENDGWLRTVDLTPRSAIMVGEWGYRVVDVRIDRRGYLVQVERMRNYKRAVICISHANIYKRYWRPFHYLNDGDGNGNSPNYTFLDD
jgi:hypothetical protein